MNTDVGEQFESVLLKEVFFSPVTVGSTSLKLSLDWEARAWYKAGDESVSHENGIPK
ncbi:MAG: hypothetical protein ABIU05_15865 [Nitrospirales bacterium]